MKVRYMLTATHPVCSGCGYPLGLSTTLPCSNCGEHAGLTYPSVVVECDYRHADQVPPEHAFPGIVSVEAADAAPAGAVSA